MHWFFEAVGAAQGLPAQHPGDQNPRRTRPNPLAFSTCGIRMFGRPSIALGKGRLQEPLLSTRMVGRRSRLQESRAEVPGVL